MQTSIVIVTYNNLLYTRLCITSIRSYTDADQYEIIVVDNHSTDGTVEWLQQQTDIRTIYNQQNAGFPSACNQGIQVASGDAILLLNNDTIVTPNWLQNLLTCLQSSEDIGAVGTVTNYCSNYQMIPVTYSTVEDMFKFAADNNDSDPSKWEERLRLIGYCLLIKRSVVEQVGLLDEQFSHGNFEDDDYSFRIRKAGYRLMLCKDTFIHHFGSMSFDQKTGTFSQLLTANRTKFAEKWGFDPYYIADIRKDISTFIKLKGITRSFNLLHIGCNAGGTLLDIRATSPDANLYGIEPLGKAVTGTEKFATIKIGGLEKLREFEKNFFDFIVYTGSGIPVREFLDNNKEIDSYLNESGELLVFLGKQGMNNG
jgi:O-antigen biosynthesis protein